MKEERVYRGVRCDERREGGWAEEERSGPPRAAKCFPSEKTPNPFSGASLGLGTA